MFKQVSHQPWLNAFRKPNFLNKNVHLRFEKRTKTNAL